MKILISLLLLTRLLTWSQHVMVVTNFYLYCMFYTVLFCLLLWQLTFRKRIFRKSLVNVEVNVTWPNAAVRCYGYDTIAKRGLSYGFYSRKHIGRKCFTMLLHWLRLICFIEFCLRIRAWIYDDDHNDELFLRYGRLLSKHVCLKPFIY